jgi:ATP-dependent DNA helicase RecQ
MSLRGILAKVNAAQSVVEKALKMLELDEAVGKDERRLYFRTTNPWKLDSERIDRVMKMRREEQAQMQAYVDHTGCLMEFLLKTLDDPTAQACGRCANCKGKGLPITVSRESIVEAEDFLKGTRLFLNPRKQWPTGLFPGSKRKIPIEVRNAVGRSLCAYGDAGWGKLVRAGKYEHGCFSDELVQASVKLIAEIWLPDPFPQWITAIPSNRHPTLVPDFAAELARRLKLPYIPVLERCGEAQEQKSMQNSFMQAHNVYGSIAIRGKVPPGPVLLVDDIIDSGWTLTMAGYLLSKHGSGRVYPFTLAQAAGKN